MEVTRSKAKAGVVGESRSLSTTVLVLIVASALAYLWLRREPVPKVSNYVQLTHDGQPKFLVGANGPRLYLR